MTKEKYIIGVDIGGTNIRIGLISRENELREYKIERTRNVIIKGQEMMRIIDFVQQYQESLRAEYEIIAVSLGFPSIIDKSRKVILSTPNISGLDDVKIVDKMGEILEIPVFIDTDVNMLMQYDIQNKQIPAKGVTVGFYLGTGIGNAISINGEMLIGKSGVAGELGHIPIRGIHGECGCGNASCVEIIASGKRLEELCETKLQGVPIKKVFEQCTDNPVIQKFIDDLSIPLATEINILDPDYIIIGGGVVQMPAFPKELLEESIRKYVRKPYPEQNLVFIYSEEEQENGVIGAGICGFKNINKCEEKEG